MERGCIKNDASRHGVSESPEKFQIHFLHGLENHGKRIDIHGICIVSRLYELMKIELESSLQ